MSINEKTKYRISNKWNDQTKKFDQDQFDFEDKGNFAVGRMSWSIKEKDKQGEVAFVNSSIKFICFGASKDLIGSNLSAKFNIDANLCNKANIKSLLKLVKRLRKMTLTTLFLFSRAFKLAALRGFNNN